MAGSRGGLRPPARGEARGGAAQARGLLHVRREAGLGQGQRVPVERGKRRASVAWGGHLVVLHWARKHDLVWDNTTRSAAAEGGHLAVLQWLREHGCPWDASTCSNAAGGGNLEVL